MATINRQPGSRAGGPPIPKILSGWAGEIEDEKVPRFRGRIDTEDGQPYPKSLSSAVTAKPQDRSESADQ